MASQEPEWPAKKVRAQFLSYFKEKGHTIGMFFNFLSPEGFHSLKSYIRAIKLGYIASDSPFDLDLVPYREGQILAGKKMTPP